MSGRSLLQIIVHRLVHNWQSESAAIHAKVGDLRFILNKGRNGQNSWRDYTGITQSTTACSGQTHASR